jgi:hypothetical protein
MGLQPNELKAHIEHDAAEVASLIRELPSVAWPRLIGPVWFDSDSFRRLSSIRNIRSPNGNMSISPDLKVILDAGHA